jgi:hypothetical protein
MMRVDARALDRAIKRKDWERAALYLLLLVAQARREAPDAGIDDLIDALTFGEDGDDGPP